MASELVEKFGRFGVWVPYKAITAEQAAAIEQLGYGAIWLGGSPPSELAIADELLEATSTLTVATGITNIWNTTPADVAATYERLEAAYPGRFVLGVGAGHREATAEYREPMAAVNEYLDGLDAAGVPPQRRVLAALGPKMLRLAVDRAAGAHPYLTPVAHTAAARDIVGPDAFLAPEHKAVVGQDGDQARQVGRPYIHRPYLGLRNYVSNLKRFGYTDADIADGGSDPLIDALLAYGSPAQTAELLTAHLEAGADHVTIQPLPYGEGWLDGLAHLAPALGLGR